MAAKQKFPTLAEVQKALLEAQLEVNNNPALYFDYDFDEDGHNAYEDLEAAKKELYERMKYDFIDAWTSDEGLFDELTDDLPDGRESYSDDALEDYVAEIAEENFEEEYGRDASDLDLKDYWDELLKIDPSLVGYVGPALYLSVTSGGKLRKELLVPHTPSALFDRSPHKAITTIFYCPTGDAHEGYNMGFSLAARNYLDGKAVLAELKKTSPTFARRK